MQWLDWLRDGFLGDGTRYRRVTEERTVGGEREEREDPSGRHDFGRRAHHPDPKGRYEFGVDPSQRMVRPRTRYLDVARDVTD